MFICQPDNEQGLWSIHPLGHHTTLKIKGTQLNLKHMFSKRKRDAELYVQPIIIYEILKHVRQSYRLFKGIRTYAVKGKEKHQIQNSSFC